MTMPVGKTYRPAVKLRLFYGRAATEIRWFVVSGQACCKNVRLAACGAATAREFRQRQFAPTAGGIERCKPRGQNSS
jgi:hypothetical protein